MHHVLVLAVLVVALIVARFGLSSAEGEMRIGDRGAALLGASGLARRLAGHLAVQASGCRPSTVDPSLARGLPVVSPATRVDCTMPGESR